MAGRPRKNTRLTVSMDDQDYMALEAIASKSDVSLSWVIRQAIHRFVMEQKAQLELPLALARDEESIPLRKRMNS
jgi:predicted transcriptional regulator